MILHRTNLERDSNVLIQTVANQREAEQCVAWCATDNLGQSKRDASRQAALAARAFADGEPFDLHPYRFELTKEPTPS